MRIQHNIMAMNAYRNYNTNTSALSKNLEKLSSGYKINRAGDDAAGLAISEKMRAQITGLNAASKNVKDGISLVKTAEGAMQEIQDMLNRMDYLATQSANGTYDNEVDRANLQKEVDALKTEINRIADSANFNGIKLLDGSLDEGQDVVNLAPGAKDVSVTHIADGQLVTKEPQAGKYSIDFSQGKLSNLGSTMAATYSFKLSDSVTVDIKVDANAVLEGEGLANAVKEALEKDMTFKSGIEYNGGQSSMKFNVSTEGSKLVLEMVDAPDKDFNTKLSATITGADGNEMLSVTGEQFQVTPEVEAVAKTSREYAQGTFTLDPTKIKDGSAIKIGDTTYVFAVGKNSKFKDYDGAVDLTEFEKLTASEAGIVSQRLAAAAKNNKNFYVGSNLNDGTISLTEKEGGVDYSKNNLAGTDNKGVLNGGGGTVSATSKDWAGLVQTGTASISNKASGTALTLQIGDTSDSFNQMKVSVGDMHTKAMGIDGIDISNQTGAAGAVQTIKDAINYVSGVRGDLGAIQNRLEHTQNNLSVMAENIQDAESTIRDTDVAEEMMSYVKNNILVQSAQAMLAQANQVPQGVLQLLG